MKIDFYLIPAKTSQARLLFACRLLEKAYLAGHQVYVQAEDAAMAHQLNDLLWTFRDISFVPHQIKGDGNSPIQIDFGDHELLPHSDILLNLQTTIPRFFIRFNRVIEIVSEETICQNNAREHYQYYRDKGYSINMHDLRKK